jgi:uncharacterized protein YjbJ (UPF0337 family)
MGKSASEVRADIEDTRRDMSDTVDAIADRTSPRRIVRRRRERVTAGWRSMRERVMGKAESAYGTAADQAGRVPDAAREAATTVTETAQAVPQKVAEGTQGNPIAAGIVAFGAGLLVASILPPSEAEQKAAARLREKAGPLQEELGEAGRQVVEDVKSAAQEGVEQVKSTASDAAANVQEDVRSSARQVSEQARN